MQKRCTNSACRRMFNAASNGGVCPHCGKAYPRALMATKGYDFIQITKKRDVSSKMKLCEAAALFRMMEAVEVWACADKDLLRALLGSSVLIAVPNKSTLTQKAHQNLQAMQQLHPEWGGMVKAAQIMPAHVNVETIIRTLRQAGCDAKRVWNAPSAAVWSAYTPSTPSLAGSPKGRLGEVHKAATE